MKKLYWDVLTRQQKKLLPKFAFLKEKGFYLAGGTALALQIGHRRSIDFDFYTEKDFDPGELDEIAKKNLPNITVVKKVKNTLIIDFKKERNHLSIFKYPYKLLQPVVKTDYFSLASTEDIAAMKLVAISQRGRRRDFVDIYFLIEKFGIERIFQMTEEKFPESNSYSALLGLVYFEDAEKKDPLRNRPVKMIVPARWNQVKKYLIKQTDYLRRIWRKR